MNRCAVWLLLFAGVAASAADDPRIVFSKTFPGSTPPFFTITVDRSGMASYNETTDPDNAETFKLEESSTRNIFELADRLDHFRVPLEATNVKVANMGLKAFRWEAGAERNESKFNYSASEDARNLATCFENIAESERIVVDLRRAIKHDRLGVNDAVLRLWKSWDNKHLMGTPQMLPLLDEVARNEVYIHMAREKAAELAEAIRAASK